MHGAGIFRNVVKGPAGGAAGTRHTRQLLKIDQPIRGFAHGLDVIMA